MTDNSEEVARVDPHTHITGHAIASGDGRVYQVAHGTQNILQLNFPEPSSLSSSTSVQPPWRMMPRSLRGREDLLADIGRALEPSLAEASDTPPINILRGLGGCGKTALALSLARNFLSQQDTANVFWVRCSDPMTMQAATIETARSLGASPYSVELARMRQVSPISILSQSLATTEQPWLLVFDGIDEASLIAEVANLIEHAQAIPQFGLKGALLMTTRLGAPLPSSPGVVIHAVAPLDAQSGGELLLDLLGERTLPSEQLRTDAENLSERLGGLPLALTAAGRYLAMARSQSALMDDDEPVQIAEYTQALDTKFSQLVGDEATYFDSEQEREVADRGLVSSTWDLSLDRLDQAGRPKARELLRLLCMLAPTTIPFSLLRNVPLAIPQNALGQTATVRAVRHAVNSLVNFGLLDFRSDFPKTERSDELRASVGVILHRVVRDTFRAEIVSQGDTERVCELLSTAVLALTKGIQSEVQHTKRADSGWEELVPHLKELMQWGTSLSDDSLECLSDAANMAAQYALTRHDAQVALDITRDNCTMIDARHDRLTPRSRQFHEDLAFVLMKVHRHEEAEKKYRELLTLSEGQLDKTDRSILRLRRGLATVLSAKGESERSVSELSEITAAMERTLGPRDVDTLITRGELATALTLAGEDVRAEQEYRVVLAALAAGGPVYEDLTLGCRQQMFHVLRRLGKLEKARGQLEELLRHHDLNETRQAPQAIMNAIEYQSVLAQLGTGQDWSEAIKLLVQELTSKLDSADPRVVMARGELVIALTQEGQLVAAESESRKIYQLLHDNFGEAHPNSIIAHQNVALLLERQEKYPEARWELQKLAGLCIKTYGRLHPITARVLKHLEVYNQAIRIDDWRVRCTDELTFLAGRIYEDLDAQFGPADHSVLLTKQNFAERLADVGQVDDAREQWEQLIVRLSLTDGDVVTECALGIWVTYAEFLGNNGRTVDAINELQSIIVLRTQLGDLDVEAILENRLSLAKLLRGEGRWRAAADQLCRGIAESDASVCRDCELALVARHELANICEENHEVEQSVLVFHELLRRYIWSRRALGHDFQIIVTNFLVCQQADRLALPPEVEKIIGSRERTMARMMTGDLDPASIGPATRRALEEAMSSRFDVANYDDLENLESEHPTFVLILGTLMSLIVEFGDSSKAALRVWEGAAQVLYEAGALEKAEFQYRNCLGSWIVYYGPDEEEALRVRNSLANVLREAEKFADAEREYSGLLEYSDDDLSKVSVSVIKLEEKLVTVLREQIKLSEAEARLKTLLDGVLEVPIAEAIHLRYLLGEILEQTGSLEAIGEYRRAFELSVECWGLNHHNTLLIYGKLSQLSENSGLRPQEITIHPIIDKFALGENGN